MANSKPQIGTIVWRDLTVADAEGVRDFYRDVVGWESQDVAMGEYSDYSMLPAGELEPAAGICHARGPNAKMPAQWLVYIVVADVEASARKCVERGGELLDGPRPMGDYRVCVIKDPAGAVAALVQ